MRLAAAALPRSGLRDVVERLQADPLDARDRMQRLRDVLTEDTADGTRRARWEAFMDALGAMGCDDDGWAALPGKSSTDLGTPLLDALEWNRVEQGTAG